MRRFPLLTAISILIAVSAAAAIKPSAVASNGFELGRTIANRAIGSHQRRMSLVDMVSRAEKTDIGETPDIEPWGPFRTSDW
jgi:hypothetical protein